MLAARIRTIGWACAALVSTALTALPATAAPNFAATGTNVSGGLDLDWWVSTGYGSFDTSKFVQAHTWAHGAETWITDDNAKQNQWFTFRQAFDLTGYDASTASLKFYWGCDDIPGAVGTLPVFSINGGAFQGGGTCTGYNIGSNLVTLNSGFVAGANHIDFRVEGNYATNGMGLKVESFTAQPVPEPGTAAMLLAGGLLGLGLRARARPEA